MKSWKAKTATFLISQAITMFGSSLVQFAIMWYVTRETDSGLMVTLMTVCAFLPQVLISVFAGVWADRYNRKLLIILADAGIAVATLVLVIIMRSGGEFMWALYVISIIRSIGSGIQMPAVNALIPQLVPKENLMKVSGINGSLMSLINFAAPAVSGFVLSLSEVSSVMMIDIVTAIIGISVFLFVPVASHAKAAEKQKTGYFDDLKQGIVYSTKNPFVRRTMELYVIFTILLVPAAFLNVLFVTRVYGDSYTYLTLNEMAFSVGAMLGGIILGAWGGFKNRLLTLGVGAGLFGLCTVAVGFIDVFWVYLVVMLITGITMPMCNSPVMVLMQEKVDHDILGRVFSLLSMVFSLFMPIGMAVFGPLADVIPIQWIMIGTGAAMVLLAVIMRLDKKYYAQGITPKADAAEE